jgi:GT2 family glycosyltransferase
MRNNVSIDVAVLTLEWLPLAEAQSRQIGGVTLSSGASLDVRCLTAINSIDTPPNSFKANSSVGEETPSPGTSVIWTGGNLGYGGGNNVAAAWVLAEWSPRYLLILNPDVTIDLSAVEALVKQADSEPEVAVLGPVQMVSAGGALKPRAGLRYLRPLSVVLAVSRRVASINYLNGGALLIRVSALGDEPPFSDEFFLFFEELELCDRMRRGGYKIAVCEESCVTHFEGGVRDARRDAHYCVEVAEYFENLNALRFTKKYCPWWLPTVLVVRLLLKPVVLLARRDRVRFGFWWLAIEDFFLCRVSRFPFQQGWNPRLSGESLRDAPWPKFASKADLR